MATHRTVGKAAAALHLTSSAVSQQLATLEREAGVALTEPAGRGIRLTAQITAAAVAEVAIARSYGSRPKRRTAYS